MLARYGVNLNREKSEIRFNPPCKLCGYPTRDSDAKPNFMKDLVIDEEEWNGLRLFFILDFGYPLEKQNNLLYVSEEGHDLLLKQGFTNLRMIEAGRIEKAGHGIMKPYREQADYDFWKPEEYVEPLPKPKRKRTVKKKN